MQGFIKSVDQLRAILKTERENNDTWFVVSSSALPAWAGWFIYHEGYPRQDDGYYWIVPNDGIGAWMRVNSSTAEAPPAPPAG